MLCSQPNTQSTIQNLLQLLLAFTVQIYMLHMSNLMLIAPPDKDSKNVIYIRRCPNFQGKGKFMTCNKFFAQNMLCY